MRIAFLILIVSFTTISVHAQKLGAGFVMAATAYEQYVNPHSGGDESAHSAGSFLLNVPPGMGVKLWAGGEDLKFTLEGRAHFAPFATHLKVWDEFSGIGAISFPILMKMNFYGPKLNYFTEIPGPTSPWTDKHWAIGFGYQYTRTDLFFRPDDAVNERRMFKTFLGSVEYGIVWGNGLWVDVFAEFGIGERSSSVFRFGVNTSLCLLGLSDDIFGDDFVPNFE